MTHSFTIGLLISLSSSISAQALSKEWAKEEIQFGASTYPLLVEKCFPCHGGSSEKIKGDLNLTSLEGWLIGGESGKPAAVKGQAELSQAIAAVKRVDPETAMPPKEADALSPEEIDSLTQWIDEGMVWLDPNSLATIQAEYSTGEIVTTSGGLTPAWDQRQYDPESLWAWRPLQKHPVPADPFADSSHPVDRWLNKSIREKGLAPAKRAARSQWLRRVTFDLIGLSPTPEELEDFLNDTAPDEEAFSKVVNRLLCSPHFGEHWARHWLDVTRYADSAGLANDYARGNAWRFRDYVIRSFNQNKPFDQFIREQIAGDEMYEKSSDEERDPEWLIATGFLRMGPWELTGMEVAKVARQRFLDDVTDIVGQTFLAQPLQCARCHDHKFDPIPTRDYYRFQSVFGTTQVVDRKAGFLDEENLAGFEAEEVVLRERWKRFESILAELNEKEKQAGKTWAAERGIPYIPRNQGLKQGVDESLLPPKKVGFEPVDFGMERIARKGMERLRWELERYQPQALAVYTGATPDRKSINSPLRIPEDRSQGEMEQTSILTGGDPFSPADPTRPGALTALEHFNPALKEIVFPETPEGRRLALAEWIAHPENPLTTRVFVNRVWSSLMGKPLVASPNNFGVSGSRPSHPELLDWLALKWMEQGRTPKELVRLITTSAAYQRSALATESEEGLRFEDLELAESTWARFPSRRLSSEQLRDAMLHVSGALNPEIGGIPVRPEIHMEIALQPRMVMGTFAAAWQPSPKPEDRHRRSIYTLKIRGISEPFQEAFNHPNLDLSCERRDAIVTPTQVFALLHGRFTYQRAVGLALRLMRENGVVESSLCDLSSEQKQDWMRQAGRLVWSRDISDSDAEALALHWDQMTELHQNRHIPRTEYPLEITREAAEENTGEKFTFTEPLEFYREFQPDPEMADLNPEARGLAEVGLVLLNSNEFFFLD